MEGGVQLERSKRKRGWAGARRSRVHTAAVEAWPYRRVPRSRTATDQRDTPSRPMARQSLRLAALVFLQYGLLASDIRFVTNANYLGIALVNICIAINTWYLTRGIIDARSVTERLCFIAGGTAGALVAVLLT
jgi:hypothetical protein